MWQHKVLPVYEEVLYQHPQGEEQVEGPKDVENNCKPIRKHWHKCTCHPLKGHIGTVKKKRNDSESVKCVGISVCEGEGGRGGRITN